jgi:hypothetical protein
MRGYSARLVVGSGGLEFSGRPAFGAAFCRLRERSINSSMRAWKASGAVGEEGELRHMAHAHALLQLKADVALGSFEAGDGIRPRLWQCL